MTGHVNGRVSIVARSASHEATVSLKLKVHEGIVEILTDVTQVRDVEAIMSGANPDRRYSR